MLTAYADYVITTIKLRIVQLEMLWIDVQVFWIDVQLAFRR